MTAEEIRQEIAKLKLRLAFSRTLRTRWRRWIEQRSQSA